jgi:hypothetical protein
MSYTVGDNIRDREDWLPCIPPWPTKDWCHSRGGSAPPPWRENPDRGDQSVPNYVGEAVGDKLDFIKLSFYGVVALLVFWLAVRALEAYAEIKD